MTAAPSSPGPLRDLLVVDFTRVLAGPYCSLMLADQGAEVIKVENPDGGDEIRQFIPPSIAGISTYYLYANRNKKSVTLDLQNPEGRSLARRLAEKADILVENFRTGVMAKLGLDYDTLQKNNPRLIYCSISGYGRQGPEANRAGYDPILQAETGLMALTGEVGGAPLRIGVSLVDLVAGLYASQAVTAALHHRSNTGEGQLLEVSLYDTGLNMCANFMHGYLMAGVEPRRVGNGNQAAQPANLYSAADGDFVLAIAGNRLFERLCREVINRPEWLNDPKFASNEARLLNENALTPALNGLFAKDTRAAWLKRLHAAGIPAGTVRSIPEAAVAAESLQTGVIRETQHPVAGTIKSVRPAALFHGTPLPAPEPARALGADTEDVLARHFGINADGFAALQSAGAFGKDP